MGNGQQIATFSLLEFNDGMIMNIKSILHCDESNKSHGTVSVPRLKEYAHMSGENMCLCKFWVHFLQLIEHMILTSTFCKRFCQQNSFCNGNIKYTRQIHVKNQMTVCGRCFVLFTYFYHYIQKYTSTIQRQSLSVSTKGFHCELCYILLHRTCFPGANVNSFLCALCTVCRNLIFPNGPL